MDTQGYIKVFTGNFIIGNRIVEELHSKGIVPVVKDESESARLAGYGQLSQGIQDIFVTEYEYNIAKEIANNVLSELEV